MSFVEGSVYIDLAFVLQNENLAVSVKALSMQVVDPHALKKLLQEMQVASDKQRLVALLSVMLTTSMFKQICQVITAFTIACAPDSYDNALTQQENNHLHPSHHIPQHLSLLDAIILLLNTARASTLTQFRA